MNRKYKKKAGIKSIQQIIQEEENRIKMKQEDAVRYKELQEQLKYEDENPIEEIN